MLIFKTKLLNMEQLSFDGKVLASVEIFLFL